MEGVRHDQGKPRMDLIPQDTLIELATIMTQGLKKYDAHNWAKGMDWSKCQASLMRHLAQWSQGVDRDPETDCLHIAHVMCNAMFLTAYQLRDVGNDDRQKNVADTTFEAIADKLDLLVEKALSAGPIPREAEVQELIKQLRKRAS